MKNCFLMAYDNFLRGAKPPTIVEGIGDTYILKYIGLDGIEKTMNILVKQASKPVLTMSAVPDAKNVTVTTAAPVK